MTRRHRERGSAMLVTMVLVSSLLAGGAVVMTLTMASTRSTDMTRSAMSALYCAEAGLAAARPVVAAQYASWGPAMGQATEPAFLNGISHDLDGDGASDFTITLRDNDDELPPLTDDPTRDNDLKVYIVSTCTKYPDIPRQVSELVLFNGGGGCYQSQAGGCGGNGNSN